MAIHIKTVTHPASRSTTGTVNRWTVWSLKPGGEQPVMHKTDFG